MYCKDGNSSPVFLHYFKKLTVEYLKNLMLEQYFPTANVVSDVFRKGYICIYMLDRHHYVMFWSQMSELFETKLVLKQFLKIHQYSYRMHDSNKLTILTCSCLMFNFSGISGYLFKGIHNLKWTCMALQAPPSGCWCWQESAFLQCGSPVICDYSCNFWKTLSTICDLQCGYRLLNNMQMCHL